MSKQVGIEVPQVTVDVVIFTISEGRLKVLLLERADDPYRGILALPGGFMWENERLELTAGRILLEKTGLNNIFVEQLYSFDAPKRDPRGRILSITYYALIEISELVVDLNQHKAGFISVDDLPKDLAFDHNQIIDYAVNRLRSKVLYTNSIRSLLPAEFTLNELQKCYEIIVGLKLDKRNFRKKYLDLNLITPTGRQITGLRHRPAALYKFIDQDIIELPSPAFSSKLNT